MEVELTPEHEWLQKLVGDWTMDGVADGGPDNPECKSTGTESARSMGGVWVLCEGQGSMPDGKTATMLMALGYDPSRKKFVGSWIGSMMTGMWVYEGELNEGRTILSLHTQGPSFSDPNKTGQYKDAIEFLSNDHRTLTSHVQNEDGSWHAFMKADYKRVI